MTQIVDKKLKLMCDCCKSHFDKPCAWLSLGNEYCTEIMEIQKELEEKYKEIERLKKYMQDNLEVNEHNEYIVYIGTNEDDLSKIIGGDNNE